MECLSAITGIPNYRERCRIHRRKQRRRRRSISQASEIQKETTIIALSLSPTCAFQPKLASFCKITLRTYTTIGLGYCSAINQKIDGTMSLPGGFPFVAPFSTPGSVRTTINMPDVVSLGLRQRLSPQWMVMATAEWTNWSRIGTSTVTQPNGAVALVGLDPVTLPFQFEDGWFFSVGAEYQWNDKLAVRGGVGYEKSPVTDQVRMPLLPDNDRYWLSVGATYRLTPKMSFDLAYSHLFVKSASIDLTSTANPWFIPGATAAYAGDVAANVDIISVALKYRWDNPAPAPTSTLYHK